MSDVQRMVWGAIALVVFLLVVSSTFVVPQAQQALVLQFGRITRIEQTPGLKFKVPLLEEVQYIDKRLLDFNAEPRELITKDSERIVVDAFLRYRITDPVQYYVAVRNEQTLHSRLGAILESSIRQVIASVPLRTVLAEDRVKLMQRIRETVNGQMRGTVEGTNAPKGGYGIDVVDVRIMRADLPTENSDAVYARMRSERAREASEFRARGVEEATKIRADADRQKVVMLAEAQKKASLLRGEGDAEAARVYNEAIGHDPQFFAKWRSLQAYRATLKSSNTSVVLSPGSGFLKEFGAPEAGK